MLIRLNFLKSAILNQRKRKVRVHVGLAYFLIWAFSLYTMVCIYRSNVFVVNTYKKEIENLRKQLGEVNVDYWKIRRLYKKRLAEESKIRGLIGGGVRPSVILDELVTLAEHLPENMWVEEIEFSSQKDKKKKDSDQVLCIKGGQILTMSDLDSNVLQQFDSFLRQFQPFGSARSQIQIDKFKVNRLGKDFFQKFTISYRW